MTLRGVTAVVLAAGHSRRMGVPKALAEFRGEGLLRSHLDQMRRRGAARCIVVIGDEGDRIRAAHDDREVVWVVNPAPRRGPFSSLVLAVTVGRRLGGAGAAYLVTPVDVPPASQAVMTALARAVADGASAAIPLYGDRGGHPVWLAEDGMRRVMSASGAPARLRLDHVMASWGSAVRRVHVSDAAVLRNLNTPADLLGA